MITMGWARAPLMGLLLISVMAGGCAARRPVKDRAGVDVSSPAMKQLGKGPDGKCADDRGCGENQACVQKKCEPMSKGHAATIIPAAELFPKDTLAVWFITQPGVGVAHFREILTKVGKIGLNPFINTAYDEMQRSLGFNPFSADGMVSAGANPDLATAIGVRVNSAKGDKPEVMGAIAVTDEVKFRKWFFYLLRRVAGDLKVEDQELNGRKYVVYSERLYYSDDDIRYDPLAALTFHKGYALIGESPEALNGWTNLPADGTLASDAAFNKALGKVNRLDSVAFINTRQIYAMPAVSKLLKLNDGNRAESDFSVVASGLTRSGLWMEAFSHVAAKDLERARQVSRAAAPPPSYAELLHDALMLFKFSLNPNMTLDLTLEQFPDGKKTFDRMTAEIARDTGIDLRKDFLDLLTGNGALAFFPADSSGMNTAIAMQVKNPLSYATIVFMLQVNDREKARAALKKVVDETNKSKQRLSPVDVNGQMVWVFVEKEAGAVAGLLDDRLIIAGGASTDLMIDRFFRRPTGKSGFPGGVVDKLKASDTQVFYMDIPRFYEVLKAVDLRPVVRGKESFLARVIYGTAIKALTAFGYAFAWSDMSDKEGSRSWGVLTLNPEGAKE